MCIGVFIWKSHPLYPFLLLLNRDEFHDRPTTPLVWWKDGDEDGEILGGRDCQAGGTWLACSRTGRLAFLTNVRELNSKSQAKSRGELIVRFLKSKKSPNEFGEELVVEAEQFNGFNLIVADLCSSDMVYITNRPRSDGLSITQVSPGIHVLSNAQLDTPWPKAQRLEHSFKDLLDRYGTKEMSMEEMADKLMMDSTKDEDESKLPCVYPPDFEYQLSSIFIETDTPRGQYGTRTTSVIMLRNSGELSFYERSYLERSLWKDHKISYKVEKYSNQFKSSTR